MFIIYYIKYNNWVEQFGFTNTHEQHMQIQNNTEMEDEYDSQQILQNSASMPKAMNQNSERDQSMSFAQLAKLHLREYDDIDENQFQFIEQSENINMNVNNQSLQPNNYLKLHSTVVPIGHMFQADVPDIMPISMYLKRNINQINRVNFLKIHDPDQNQQFYAQNKSIIEKMFGVNRTYQQIACIKKCMHLYKPGCTLQEYFSDQRVIKFWQDHFKYKDSQALKKLKKKKKKYKGSMDI